MECRLILNSPLPQLGPHCIFSSRTGLEGALQLLYLKLKKNLQNSETDLCLSLLTLHKTESLWHPVLSLQPDYKLAVYINS